MKGGSKEEKKTEMKSNKEKEKEDWRVYILTWGFLKDFYCIVWAPVLREGVVPTRLAGPSHARKTILPYLFYQSHIGSF